MLMPNQVCCDAEAMPSLRDEIGVLTAMAQNSEDLHAKTSIGQQTPITISQAALC